MRPARREGIAKNLRPIGSNSTFTSFYNFGEISFTVKVNVVLGKRPIVSFCRQLRRSLRFLFSIFRNRIGGIHRVIRGIIEQYETTLRTVLLWIQFLLSVSLRALHRHLIHRFVEYFSIYFHSRTPLDALLIVLERFYTRTEDNHNLRVENVK